MAEPQDITKNPDGSVVVLAWAEAGAAVEPSAGRKSTGELVGDLYTSNEHNWLGREPMRWLRALFSRYVNASEGLGGSYLVPNGAGVWSTNGVAALEGFLSDAPAGPDVLVADVWLDAAGGGAVRVQVSVPKGGPKTFLATRDTYVFVPWDLIVPPTVSLAELTFVDVPVGDPAPVIPIGTVGIWRVETDGVTIVDQEILVPTFPIMKTVGFETVRALSMMISGTLDVDGLARLNDTDFLSGAAVNVETGSTLTANAGSTVNLETSVTVGVGGVDALTVKATSTFESPAFFQDACELGDGPGDAILVKGSATVSAPAIFNDTSTFNKLATIIGGVGAGLTSDASAILNWNGVIVSNGRLQIVGTTLSAAGDVGIDVNENPRWFAQGASRFMHISDVGAFKSHGNVETIAPGATITLNTTSSVAPKVASDVDVFATANLQRAVAGTVTVTLIALGVGPIGSSESFDVPVVGGGATFSLVFARTYAADTTPRLFQLSIAGNGQDVLSGTARITATPAAV